MNLIQDKLTIVMAGAFNPAILTPQWIAKNALGYAADQQIQVEMMAPMVGYSASPRFTFDNISFAANYQSLTFFLANLSPAGVARVCHTAGALLEQLPHTPLGGIGFNFGFKVESPSADLLALLCVHDGMTVAFGDDASVVNRGWSNTIRVNDSLVAFQCQLDGADVSIDVNFHHNVASAVEAAALMRKADIYAEQLATVVEAVKALTGQELEGQ